MSQPLYSPEVFNLPVGALCILDWYDQGNRCAAARIEQFNPKQNWVLVRLWPASAPSKTVKLYLVDGAITGKRQVLIDIRKQVFQVLLPNAAETESIRKRVAEDPDVKEDEVEVPAEDFGEAGVTRTRCDKCRKPVVLAWKGRYGVYCSNNCLKTEDQQGDLNDMTDESTPDTKPIRAGAASPKKKTGAKKAAAPKKTPAKKAAGDGAARANAKFADDATIHMKADAENPFRADSSRAQRFALLKDGMTVADFKKKVEAKNLQSPFTILSIASDLKLITIK